MFRRIQFVCNCDKKYSLGFGSIFYKAQVSIQTFDLLIFTTSNIIFFLARYFKTHEKDHAEFSPERHY